MSTPRGTLSLQLTLEKKLPSTCLKSSSYRRARTFAGRFVDIKAQHQKPTEPE